MSASQRSQLIDGLRASAVIAMIIYHFGWDLGEFGFLDRIKVNSGYWKIFAQSVGVSFLFISGVSFWMSVSRGINAYKFILRLSVLLAAAMSVTLGTYIFAGESFVFFGILHLLAACSIFGLLVFRFPPWVLFLLVAFLIIMPQYFSSAFFEPRYLSWTGLYNSFTGSVDFYGFMPWSAAYILGLAFAKSIVKHRLGSVWTSSGIFIGNTNTFFERGFFWIGRNSLFVYIVHQPILIGAIYCFQRFV
mgnify:CR=1 FL=1